MSKNILWEEKINFITHHSKAMIRLTFTLIFNF